MLIEHYLDLIESDVHDLDFLEQQSELEHVRNIIENPDLCPEIPEDFDLHAEYYYQGELVDYHGR